MKRILVISDTHKRINNCLDVLDNIIGINIIIHLGDCVSDANDISYIHPDIEIVKIRGNNDFDFSAPAETIVEIGNVRIFCCHGHMYSKKTLFKIAQEQNCQIVLCGHTHISEKIIENGIVLLNPGSISRPRDNSCSYGIIEIENNKFNLDIIKGENI